MPETGLLDPASVRLPSQAELHELIPGGRLDFSNPRARHFLDNRPDSLGLSRRIKVRPGATGLLFFCKRLLGRAAAQMLWRLRRRARP